MHVYVADRDLATRYNNFTRHNLALGGTARIPEAGQIESWMYSLEDV